MVSLLGNTLGDMRHDRKVLVQLHDSVMFPDDLLLLEVKKIPSQGGAGDTLGRIE